MKINDDKVEDINNMGEAGDLLFNVYIANE